MNGKDYSLLVIGNFTSVYVIQLVRHLKQTNPQARIFFWGYSREKCDVDRSFLDCFEDYCLFDIKHIVHSTTLWQIKAVAELRKNFRNFASGKYFDYISIQYIKPEYYFLNHYFKMYSKHLVLTPWGSDVYRVNGIHRFFVKKTFEAADFLTGPDDRFTRDFTKLFHVPENKIVHCDLGVAPIDYIIEHKHKIDGKEAKHQLNIENNYVITCGYNAASAHRHLEIIEAVNKVRSQLPENLLLLFPLTYHKEEKYINSIKQKVMEYGLKAIFFEEFLDIPHLFLLRQATDLFIHIQPTDASSGTLYEYILCEKKILNGSWLQYPEIEQYGAKPYYPVESMDTLGEAIVNAVNSEPIHIDERVLTDLAKKQWKVVIKDWDKFFLANRNHE